MKKALQHFCRFLLIISCFATLLIYLLPNLWLSELLSHFPFYHCIYLILIITLLLFLRSWKPFLLGVMLLVIHGFTLAPLWIKGNKIKTDTPPIKVIAFNVLTSNSKKNEVIQFLQKEDADLLSLIEVDTRWIDALKALHPLYPYRIEAPRADNFGIALFSKHPLQHQRIEYWSKSKLPSILAEINLNGTLVNVIATHPEPPGTPHRRKMRDDVIHTIIEETQFMPTPLIVMGDLNATPFCSIYKKLIQESPLAPTHRGWGYQSTWKGLRGLLLLPIDHILHSHDLYTLDKTVGPDLGSDHYPLISTLQMKSTPKK